MRVQRHRKVEEPERGNLDSLNNEGYLRFIANFCRTLQQHVDVSIHSLWYSLVFLCNCQFEHPLPFPALPIQLCVALCGVKKLTDFLDLGREYHTPAKPGPLHTLSFTGSSQFWEMQLQFLRVLRVIALDPRAVTMHISVPRRYWIFILARVVMGFQLISSLHLISVPAIQYLQILPQQWGTL